MKHDLRVVGDRVGDSTAYTVTGTPGAAVSWSSTKDGVTVEDHAFYGHHLDANGLLTVNTGQWAGSAVGSWVKQVHVGTEVVQTGQTTFTVSHPPVRVETDKAQYHIGENITYAVTGPPNQQIRWTSTINGLPSGESDAYYGHTTDADGVFTVTVPWTDPRGGTWTEQITIGGQTAQISFEAVGWTQRPGAHLDVAPNGQVYFIDPSGQVVVDYWDGVWRGPFPIGGTARAHSPLAISPDGKVFFIDPSGQVVVDYWDGVWRGPFPIGGIAR